MEEDPGTGYRAPGAAREIARVRYELRAGVRRTGYQTQDGTTGLLFVDASSPGAFEVPAGSLVSVDGGPECCVASCSRYVDESGRVHHWELELR